jgi:tetratricopeptide (TPR) repeat protein
VARLADGLQHAHQRGVLHHDIKPSNILLGADGRPMLLDFNLARNVHDTQAQTAAVLGGTVAYMAPEHLRALTSRGRELVRKADHRSDIYSLGMVLFEVLVGQGPFAHKGSCSALPVLIELMALERSRALWEDRALYLARLGDRAGARAARDQARQVVPAGVRDHYLLAVSYARSGRYADAVAELGRALQQNPRPYWSSFQRGICHQELGRHVLAAGDFGTCVGLWPEAVANRRPDRALAAFDEVLARDPGHPEALYGRAMILAERGGDGEALAHLDRAIEARPGFLEARRCRAVLQARRRAFCRSMLESDLLRCDWYSNGTQVVPRWWWRWYEA